MKIKGDADILTRIKIPKEDIIEWVKDNLSPEDVFDYNQLCSWAKDNISILNE